MVRRALHAERVFDGDAWHEDAAVLIEDDAVLGIVAGRDIPAGVAARRLPGMLVPGFVDLQVNGGGGIMMNDRQDVEAIRTICAAHARFGTTALLPTLITDTPEATRRTVAAGHAAARQKVPGFLGLHLEGPHISLARKGAHDPALIRPMNEDDEAALIAARRGLAVLMVTGAPESVAAQQVARLAAGGVAFSLGHSDTDYATARRFAEAGAALVTHLFNAMSQVGNREPGLAGATIEDGRLSAGLIADGIHVHPATLGLALRAKRGPGRLFLVTDAMAVTGTDVTEFTLNGRTVYRRDGSLRLADGTLAGADLDMISAVRFMHRTVGLPLEEALRMASLHPAQAVGAAAHGRIAAGSRADLVHLSEALDIGAVWIGGEQVFGD